MARHPYRIARQQHLGDMLDRLQERSLLAWHFDYDQEASSSIFWVAQPPEQAKRKLDIRRAEQVAGKLCALQGIPWLPVPHPGGETELADTLRRIAKLSGSQTGEPADSTDGETRPITAEAVNLGDYPDLKQRLHDVPGDDRSAQTFHAACICIELGLSDGQIKWFLAQYPPFLSKQKTRNDADRELDRVIRAAH